ncbi:MAG: ABC transporter ATP-binding protein [Rectinemataceae bacterium]
MAEIAFQAITKQFGSSTKPAVDAVTFTVPEDRTCMLVGKSGAGKTTLLRMVNRLIEPTSGKLVIDGKNVLEEDPIELRRHIGYVIQQVGLFPHMNIAENIRVTAEVTGGWTKKRLDKRVDELLDLVGLPPSEYRNRFPRELSGGQQQRVGLARALTTDPMILLMDEPFGALDAITRSQMQDELLRIQRNVRKTILFVTHDMEEALKLGDLIAVMHQGRLLQLGAPVDLLTHPVNDMVARLVGSDNILRELQYLTASTAVDLTSPDHFADGEHFPGCSPDGSLLAAMLKLFETHAPALVLESDDGLPVRYITLASIISTLTKGRSRESEPESATAPGRAFGSP